MSDPEKKSLTEKKVGAEAKKLPEQSWCDLFYECLRSILKVKTSAINEELW